jgi:peptidoglycan/xylan/chitin deacetylase (PgdA/CDA1 family)
MLTASGLVPALGAVRGKLAGSQVAILMYHRVTAAPDNWSLNSLHTDAFDQQLAWFARHYEVISLDRLARGLTGNGNAWPRKAVAITFDDGYKDNYRNAFPILKKYAVPATIFLTTGAIDTGELLWFDRVGYALWHTSEKELRLESVGHYPLATPAEKAAARTRIVRQLKAMPEDAKQLTIETLIGKCGVTIPEGQGRSIMLSWDDVREMAAAGITFGAHGVTHSILTNVTGQQARWEIAQSKKEIEERIRKPVSAFSYPDGKFSPELIDMARDSGFACAVSSKPYAARRLLRPGDNPYALSRLETHDLHKTRILLSGLVGDVENVLRRSRS